ncbi:TRAP transporter small permease [Alkalihalobacillus oceani]|uniref:TRAP transporter small permease n=1 Tax=Halalkalibacter oceani TaxID=1653776 RepID=UPI00203BACB3|nr:TRAP transporter small permease [Halalkalibacter oceani]MCM3762094.1 TRAP transporter small permease [Halalkalibacter oceani]
MEKIKNIMDKVLAGACALLLTFMTALITYQVVVRYVFKSPSTMSEDMLSYSFVWLSLLGSALVFGQRDHMKVSIFSEKLTGAGKVILSVLSECIILVIVICVFIFGGKEFMVVGALQMSPTLNIAMHWIYSILPLSGILIVIYNVINIIQSIQEFNGERREELL